MSSFISQKAGEFSELHAKNTGGICVQDVIRTQMKTVRTYSVYRAGIHKASKCCFKCFISLKCKI